MKEEKPRRPILYSVLAVIATFVLSAVLYGVLIVLAPISWDILPVLQGLRWFGGWGSLVVGVLVYLKNR